MKTPATILHSPRVTEKSAYLAQDGVYVFMVAPSATKSDVAEAVRTLFKVTPRQVRVVPVPRKKVQTRGTNRYGKTAGAKKAYVYLKKGETIELA